MFYQVWSGHQTGVDLAAIDSAKNYNFFTTGWVPKGAFNEDGKIPEHYKVMETPELDYLPRTVKNVEDTDCTIVCYRSRITPGSRKTRNIAHYNGRLYFEVDLDKTVYWSRVADQIKRNRIEKINVAGTRESLSPGIYRVAEYELGRLWELLKNG